MLVLDLCAFKVQDSGYVQLRLSALFIPSIELTAGCGQTRLSFVQTLLLQ